MSDYVMPADAGSFTLTGSNGGLSPSYNLTIASRGRPRVTEFQPNEADHRREMARRINELASGRIDCVASVTLTASAASTVIEDARLSVWSVVLPMPKTANAAAEMAAGGMYFLPEQGQVTIYHANNSQTDRIFGLALIG